MQKGMGAILLIAGTCIGSGMIALPMVFANIGIIPSILLMLFIWAIMYYTSLINLELNLQAGHGLPLGLLGRKFSGRIAEAIGNISLKLLSYSLLAVYIYGGSSVLQTLIKTHLGTQISFDCIAACYVIFAIALLLMPIKIIDYCNRLLFIGLLAIVGILMIGLAFNIHWTHLPLFSDGLTEISVWRALIPVVFTAFGFQVIFHTLTDYCNRNPRILKRAFFWGSLLPAAVYILWICTLLSVIYTDNSEFYAKMAHGKIEVGELIETLSNISNWHSVQLLVWWISLLAIFTSVIGIGVGLFQSLTKMVPSSISCPNARNFIAAIATILPAYFVVICIPNAFISVLGFAGMILTIIAILLPVYLFWQIKEQKLYYPQLRIKSFVGLSVITALVIILCELTNIFFKH